MSKINLRNYTKIMGVHQLYLCLGGNLGNKAVIFRETLAKITLRIGKITGESLVYLSPPWGFHAKNYFWNQVLQIETSLSPEEVFREIVMVEHFFGRKRIHGKYTSRKMDIDILYFDDLIIQTKELTIPHPMISMRKFVLLPMNEIMPGFRDPVSGKTIKEQLADCRDLSEVIPLNPGR